MSLEKRQFDNIIYLLVKGYINCAKKRIKELEEEKEISLEQLNNSAQLFRDYFDVLKAVYKVDNDIKLPAVYHDVCNVKYRSNACIGAIGAGKKILVRLDPLDLNAVAQQLNHDFATNHQLSNEYHIKNHQKMMIMFMLSDQPTLIQQLMALPKEHVNKFMLAMMITSVVVAVICSFTVPATLFALGISTLTTACLFSQLKKPGHREQFSQCAVDNNADKALNLFEVDEEVTRLKNF